mgnify:CR=1 FL=1
MAQIKDISSIAAKWSRRASTAGVEYEQGVRSPRRPWAAATKAAEAAYERGVQAAIARKGFGKGVSKAGDTKWQENAIAKGPSRFAEGVAHAEPAYATGFAPYASVIASTVLPERGPRGDPKNIMRVQVIAKALHDKKIGMGG